MTSSFSEYDGPRLVRREELFTSEALSRICFGGQEISAAEAFASYRPPRRGGTFVMSYQGQPVSQIGVFHDQIKMYDATIRVASIGGVCTHPDHRNQGLASLLMEHCTQKLVQEGASLMLISGDRGTYIRLGNVLHGRFCYFSIHPGQSSPWRPAPNDLVLRRMTVADALPVSRLYQAEPVHYLRQNSDFLWGINDPWVNTYIQADQWIVERAGQALAYLFLGNPWETELEAGIRHVSEYAGSRLALVDALQALMAAGNLRELSWPVPWQDLELGHLLQDCGYRGSVAPLEGHSLRIVNFPRFMQGLQPILRARLGAKLRRGLRFEQSGPLLGGSGNDRYTIVRGADRLDLDGAAMTRLVMGTTESEAESIRMPGALAEVIPAIFPLPTFLPGLNYR